MWHCSNEHHSPSWIIESTSSVCPIRTPSRTRGSRYGQLLIDSIPPATATSMSPVAMPCAANITAFSPEPQTLLIVKAATVSGSPPFRAAWRAGFCPSPALTTLPMMHSSTSAGSIPARRTASAMTSAPSCGAEKLLRDPRNLPVGVRTADTITLEFMTGGSRAYDDVFHDAGAEQRLQTGEDHARRPGNLASPRGAGCVDQEHARFEPDGRDAVDRRADRRFPGELDF